MKVIVIGGGPSGMMASIKASENHEVILLEKNNRLGVKLLMTGNGRCNVTNNKDVNSFINECSKSTRFMYYSLTEFSTKDLINYFNSKGCPLIEEENNKMFPKSNKASSILNVLEKDLSKVDIRYNHEVLDWIIKDNKVVGVSTNKGDIFGDYFICATGGLSYPKTGSDGKGYELAKKLGHTITNLYGIEVALVSNDEIILSKELMGTSFNNIKVSVVVNDKVKKSIKGDLIITHFGLSGPAILELSAFVRKNLNKKVDIIISTVDDIEFDKKTLGMCIKGIASKRWLDYLIENQNRNISEISKKDLNIIKEKLTSFKVNIVDTLPIDKATVTSGGIKTSELDPRTMRSKFHGNVCFCGELIDVQGPIGGYNLTLAFTSGYISGKGIDFC
ncbi:MAG TPA: aminoacetone oxidase family FAD-binding enzyme [Erysipelotrichaceae bacterium]|nr:aminoacetone oxidase family FAD-binding enzyme [Erysipelotrichaceae bacterium]